MMIRSRISVSTIWLVVLLLLLSSTKISLAAGIPGGDFTALASGKKAGYGLLSRTELFTSTDGIQWVSEGLDVQGDALLSMAGGKNWFFIGSAKGKIIRVSPGKDPVVLPVVKDPYGRVVSPIRMIGSDTKGKNIIISSGQGVMISKDSGETFEPANDPFWNDPSSREIRALGYVGKRPLIFTRDSVYYGDGNRFIPSWKGLPDNVPPSAVFIESTRAIAAFPRIGIFVTTNGKTWKKLVRAPDDPIAFLGTAGKGILASGPFSPIYVGDAKGKTWAKMEDISPGFAPMASLMSSGGPLISLRGKGVFRVEDGKFVQIALPVSLSSVLDEMKVPGATLAGTEGGVYRSADGKTWDDVTPVSLGVPVTDFLQLPNGRILLSSRGLGVYLSDDDGRSWVAWSGGLGTANSVRSLLLDGKMILAATENGLMERSLEDGSSWQASDRGIPRETVHKLAVSGKKIWAASTSGLYSAKAGGKFTLNSKTVGAATDISADGNDLLALVGGKLYMVNRKGSVMVLEDTPKGVSPTSVALADGMPWIGTNAGIYSQSGGVWARAWDKAYEITSLGTVGEKIRVVTAGAGTFYLP